MEEEGEKTTLYNRSFQKKEVVKKLVKNEACAKISTPLEIPESFLDNDSGYLCYIYDVTENKEYEEGFGPRVVVNIGDNETIWKRSRNKWNPFEKIRTVPKDNENSSNNFKISWDKNGLNSYYVTERMYYYLDKDKHKEKFKSIRAKLYITRMHQEGAKRFLLQFIMEKMTEAEQEQQKRIQKLKEEKRLKKQEQQQVRKESPTGSAPDFEKKDTLTDVEREMRIAAFQMSSVWNQYQHYSYLHETGYRSTFPPPNPHVAYSLGRAHLDYPENLSPLDSIVHCPTPIKASELSNSHLPGGDEAPEASIGSPVSFPQARSFQFFQPRPKSQDFSPNYLSSISPSVPLVENKSNKRPRDCDALERLKANFLAATPSAFERPDKWKVTLPPIASFPSNTPIHDVELKHKSISVESLRYCAPRNPEWQAACPLASEEEENPRKRFRGEDSNSPLSCSPSTGSPKSAVAAASVILSLNPNVSESEHQELEKKWLERNSPTENISGASSNATVN